MELLATAAASIDFPEHDIPEITSKRMLEGLGGALRNRGFAEHQFCRAGAAGAFRWL